MVRIGPVEIGSVGLATLAILTPLVVGFFASGGLEAAKRGGAKLTSLISDPIGETFGSLFEATRQFGFTAAEGTRTEVETFLKKDIIPSSTTDDLLAKIIAAFKLQTTAPISASGTTATIPNFIRNFPSGGRQRFEFVNPTQPNIPVTAGAGGFGLFDFIRRPSGQVTLSAEAQRELDAERAAFAGSGLGF